jgi:deazaflavin-dependent oxidoreductase (nitroreductase family)
MATSSRIDLDWNQLNALTEEVRGGSGPGTGEWEAGRSHTRRFNEAFIQAYREHDGKVPGELGDVDILLLTCTGAKSGKRRTVPVGFHRVDDRLVVIASMGGADHNPPWYYNVKANGEVTVELGGETFEATARVLEPADRDHVYARVCEKAPVFTEYQQRTERRLPVVEILRKPA